MLRVVARESFQGEHRPSHNFSVVIAVDLALLFEHRVPLVDGEIVVRSDPLNFGVDLFVTEVELCLVGGLLQKNVIAPPSSSFSDILQRTKLR